MKIATRPNHDAATCHLCESHETRYVVHLSVIITVLGAPGCHDGRTLLENAVSFLESAVEGGDTGSTIIDAVTVDGVTADEWSTEVKPGADDDATAFAAHQAADPHCTCNDCMADFSEKMDGQS